MPPAYLAWMPGGFPSAFEGEVGSLPGVQAAVVVAGDTLWMSESFDSRANVVTHPLPPYRVPIDAFAVDQDLYGAFVPSAYVSVLETTLAKGQAVLGATSAQIRGSGFEYLEPPAS